MLRSSSHRRQGGTTALTALLLVPLLALAAFAIDLNYIWRADAELQNAADGAAQAGATRLMQYALRGVQPGMTAADRSAVLDAAHDAVAQRAIAFGQMHQAGDVGLAVNAADVELGYIDDPGAAAGTSTGQFQTGQNAPFPNSVRVTVRRDGNVRTGPLSLFVGPVLGTPTSSRAATATVTLRGQNVTGFKGANSKLLPLALSQDYYGYLTGVKNCPPGVLQDNFSVTLRTDGGPVPPANVTAGPDGIYELTFYPDKDAPGNYGLVALCNSKTTNSAPYSNWIRNGPSAADLDTFGPNGLQATANVPCTGFGGPGLKSPLTDDLAAIVGQPRVCAIVGRPSGSGSNVTYPIVGFTGITVVQVNKAQDGVVLQLCPLIDTTATLGKGPSNGVGQFVYRGISLTR